MNDIKAIINKIIITIKKTEKNNISNLSKRLVSKYLNAYDSLPDDKRITIVIFTNTVMTNALKKIDLIKQTTEFAKYNILVFDKFDIESRKESVSNDENVSQYKLNLMETDNMLKYNDKGCIVNVSANSLKKLYNAKEKSGLFSYNLREYIKLLNVDKQINDTIKDELENFWLLTMESQ